ncbi:type I restriction enzyme HsdR N-terminal domain-containing protein [Clostridium sp. KNHs214]|uniref:type I restriction enzyme HsdR N-terminal domain-containing protein n=1 Tax=Clostridium sp. KNHs214 TaxID=1540257 RepID=UPI000550FA84|nr:type I restriction enzyme HsdR N-terminal domain-containing protein [Clostridium sp. KNHs214]
MNKLDKLIQDKLEGRRFKAVEIDMKTNFIKYNEQIYEHNGKKSVLNLEEKTTAYLIDKLVNELNYDLKSIELEFPCPVGGSTKLEDKRIDVIVKDTKNKDILFFIEVKPFKEYDNKKEWSIENQLFILANNIQSNQDINIRYLVYYTCELMGNDVVDKLIIIDHQKYKNYKMWINGGRKSISDILPPKGEKPHIFPFVKKGRNDLRREISVENTKKLKEELHNKLWGSGAVNDNEIFATLVNLILAKIHDENDTEDYKEYRFQIFSTESNGEEKEESPKEYLIALNEQIS